jgi:hypothetical protein
MLSLRSGALGIRFGNHSHRDVSVTASIAQCDWLAAVKSEAIPRPHGLERILSRGATIAAHLIAATAYGEHPAHRAVATAEQELQCAFDEISHFPELQQLELNSSGTANASYKHFSGQNAGGKNSD